MAAPQSPDECICKILNSYFPRTQHSSLGGRGSPSPPKIEVFFNIVQKGDRGQTHTQKRCRKFVKAFGIKLT